MFPLFAAGVVDNGGKLPPVQQPVANFAAGVVATGGKLPPPGGKLPPPGGKLPPPGGKLPPPGGKFAAGVVDTGGASSFGISPQIFEKIPVYPNVIFRGLGEDE